MSRFLLAPRAQSDLRDIAGNSLRRFGPLQSRRYVERITDAFADLAVGRRQGRALLAHRPLDLFLLVKAHYVVYRRRDDGRILIVRILHSRMDLSSHL